MVGNQTINIFEDHSTIEEVPVISVLEPNRSAVHWEVCVIEKYVENLIEKIY